MKTWVCRPRSCETVRPGVANCSSVVASVPVAARSSALITSMAAAVFWTVDSRRWPVTTTSPISGALAAGPLAVWAKAAELTAPRTKAAPAKSTVFRPGFMTAPSPVLSLSPYSRAAGCAQVPDLKALIRNSSTLILRRNQSSELDISWVLKPSRAPSACPCDARGASSRTGSPPGMRPLRRSCLLKHAREIQEPAVALKGGAAEPFRPPGLPAVRQAQSPQSLGVALQGELLADPDGAV